MLCSVALAIVILDNLLVVLILLFPRHSCRHSRYSRHSSPRRRRRPLEKQPCENSSGPLPSLTLPTIRSRIISHRTTRKVRAIAPAVAV